MREKLAANWLKLIRLYTYNFPIRRGKYRLFQLALRRIGVLPRRMKVSSKDGRTFAADMKTRMYDMVYFFGEYELYVTRVISSVVRDGDVCIDVGANFGWFTTLLINNYQKAKVKEIHSFEPQPSVFENLKENIKLSGSPDKVFLNNFGLSDEVRDSKIYAYEKLGSGHASLSNKVSDDFAEFDIRVTTLDRYLIENNISQVDFIKIDIEGAELKFLKGAERIFEQSVPPLIVMEMALDTTKNFGYYPDDLIKYIKSKAEYDFYALEESKFYLKKLESFNREDIGANVLCMPKKADQRRLDGLEIRK